MPDQLHTVEQAGAVGYVSPSDKRGFEVSPQAWTGMNSVRMDEGGVEPAWGYLPDPLVLPDDSHSLDYMSNRAQDENAYIVGSNAAIYAVNVAVGGEILESRNIGLVYTGDYDNGEVWVTTEKDGHLVMTNGKDKPQMVLRDEIASLAAVDLSGFATPPVVVGQPAYETCKTIIAFNGFLVAGNIKFADADDHPDMIAWSVQSDTGYLPASWDYTADGTLAGNSSMPSNYGAIIALEELRGDLMIYCERGAYRMQFTGGQYVFRISSAFDTVGSINPRATCSNKGNNVIVSRTDVLRSDGQYPVSIANGTVRHELFDQVSPLNAHKIQVIEYPERSEIIILCPDKQDDLWSGKVLAWNWSTETWSIRHGLLNRCMNNLPKLISAIDPNNPIANKPYDGVYRWGEGITDGVTEPPIEEQFDDVTDTIPSTPGSDTILPEYANDLDNYDLMGDITYGTLLADEGALYLFGIATQAQASFPTEQVEGAPTNLFQFDWLQHSYQYNPLLHEHPFVERRGINLVNDESVQIALAIYPRIEGTGKVKVFIGVVDYIGGHATDIRWDPPVIFDPAIDYRVTCRAAGRRHAIRFEAVEKLDRDGNPLNTYENFRLTGYDIEFRQTGRR